MKYKVDVNETKSYLDIYNTPCDCVCCRNYFKAFSKTYAKATKVLNEMGVVVERPLEIMDCFWIEKKNKRLYESYYSVKGELFQDKTIIYDEDVIIALYKPDTDEHIYGNTGMEMPYFILEITNVELPWVMDEMPYD